MGKLLRLDKPNQLISVIPKSEINLIQQKCFNVFLRKAQRGLMFDTKYKNKEINKNTRYIFQIACKELKDKAGLSRNDYEYIKDELKKLTTIVVEVNDKNNKDHWSIFSLLERVEREGDIFEFSLDWMIMKALKEHNYFTKIDLLQIAKLDSRYSVILYEMAKRYYDKNNKYIKIPKMTVEEFRKTTKTENKYVLMADLKRYVLDKACKEISEKTDIILSYQTEKRGRKIAYIDFKIEKKIEQNTIPIKTPTQKEYSPEVLDLFQLLPAVEQVASNKRELAKLLTDHSFRYLKADILYAKN
ncbi:Initiator Replication protein, partial [Orenia metallireducens]